MRASSHLIVRRCRMGSSRAGYPARNRVPGHVRAKNRTIYWNISQCFGIWRVGEWVSGRNDGQTENISLVAPFYEYYWRTTLKFTSWLHRSCFGIIITIRPLVFGTPPSVTICHMTTNRCCGLHRQLGDNYRVLIRNVMQRLPCSHSRRCGRCRWVAQLWNWSGRVLLVPNEDVRAAGLLRLLQLAQARQFVVLQLLWIVGAEETNFG